MLARLHELTGRGTMIFRGERHHERPMSENTVSAACGPWALATTKRPPTAPATHATMLHERLGFSPEVIEAQLAHSVRDSLGRAYNRAEFAPSSDGGDAAALADYLDELRRGAPVVARSGVGGPDPRADHRGCPNWVYSCPIWVRKCVAVSGHRPRLTRSFSGTGSAC